jgi:hypothetical protein
VIHIFIMIFKWFFTSWAFFFLTQQPHKKTERSGTTKIIPRSY